MLFRLASGQRLGFSLISDAHLKMSRSGSRYPSAFGHTPSYRSVSRIGGTSDPYGYDSLGLESRLSSRPMGSTLGSSSLSTLSPGFGSLTSSIPGGGSHQSVQYSSSSTTKSMQQVNDGVPKYSYSQKTSNYNSDEPWKNRTHSYSYNVWKTSVRLRQQENGYLSWWVLWNIAWSHSS